MPIKSSESAQCTATAAIKRFLTINQEIKMNSVTRNETIPLTRHDLQNLFDILMEVHEQQRDAQTALDLINREHNKIEQLLVALQKRFE
jgi:hypothetical protein